MQAKNLVEVTTPMPDDSADAAARKALAAVEARQIVTADDYVAAAAELSSVKGQWKAIDQQRELLKAPSLEGGRRVDDFFRAPLGFLKSAEDILKGKLKAYDDQQEALRLAEQARVDEDARRERAKLHARADKAGSSGKVEKAEQLQQAAAVVVAPVITRTTPKVAGLSFRENWYAECTDLLALVKAIAEGKAPLALVMANDKVLGLQAKSLKKDFVAPGVRVWSDKNIAAGAA